ncbi:hypothetical protein [Oryzifoliimicrobium ureilyticus]|uniref:hypothetical protein n=1 Tax=Oryzifoliimicrobium ureilyticus TaxID=3113724 RepID=UPI003075EF1D
MHLTIGKLALIALSLPVLASSQSLAQSDLRQEQVDAIIGIGSQMRAAAEACGGFSVEELDRQKQKEKAFTASMGMTAAAYDKAFNENYEASRVKIAGMSATQKQQFCQEMKKTWQRK